MGLPFKMRLPLNLNLPYLTLKHLLIIKIAAGTSQQKGRIYLNVTL